MGNRRGETLVETVVAFAVLMILLAMLASVLQGAARMNRHARQRLALLETECTSIEQNTGRYIENAAASGTFVSDTLTLTPQNDATLAAVAIPLDVRMGENGMLYYFSTASSGNGG